jgi:outer membrane protein TolC
MSAMGFRTGILLSFTAIAFAQPTPLTIDLPSALERSRAWSPQFLAASLAAASAKEDRIQAKTALLPTLNAFNGYLYTQGNGTDTGVFVANNGVHIYDEQMTVHADVLSVQKQAQYRATLAAEVAAKARQDVAGRGLASTVIQNYYGVVSALRHRLNARRSLNDAMQFEDLSSKQERGGEVARADVVKAQLQRRQRERELNEADLNVEKAKLALAVLIFQDLTQAYDVVDDLKPDAPVPPPDQSRQASFATNPDVRVAEAALNQADYQVKAARGEYIPFLSVASFSFINSTVLALHDPEGNRNIGSVVQATVTVPVWNWGATRSRVRQSQIAQRQAQNDLNFARRQIEANLNGFQLEAQASRAQVAQLDDQRRLAEESLQLTNLRYQSGEATALEVVDAQTTASDARNGYDDGLARYRLALANLEVLMGRYQ